MKRILFVDDELAVLEGLRNVMRSERRRWVAFYANGGEEALAMLAAHSADVVVTDMRMPGMDGLALLSKIRELYPDTVRIVLTGYADLAIVTQASSLAHQHLPKPCEFDDLRRVLECACDLQDVFQNATLRKTVGGLGTLPSAPRVYQTLTEALANPDIEIARLAAIVEQDVGMASRVLQFVNSAYFGLAHRITSIEGAIVCLGFTALRHLALSFQVFSEFKIHGPVGGLTFQDLERHSLLTARIARKLAQGREQAETAFAAGLLHDAGEIIFMSRFPEMFEQSIALSLAKKIPLYAAEKEVIGADHSEVGAHLLQLWGLPQTIIEPVAFHHSVRGPLDAPSNWATICRADILAQEVMPWRVPGLVCSDEAVREAVLTESKSPDWRAIAMREVDKVAI